MATILALRTTSITDFIMGLPLAKVMHIDELGDGHDDGGHVDLTKETIPV